MDDSSMLIIRAARDSCPQLTRISPESSGIGMCWPLPFLDGGESKLKLCYSGGMVVLVSPPKPAGENSDVFVLDLRGQIQAQYSIRVSAVCTLNRELPEAARGAVLLTSHPPGCFSVLRRSTEPLVSFNWEFPDFQPHQMLSSVLCGTLLMSSESRASRKVVFGVQPESGAKGSVVVLPHGFVNSIAEDSEGNLIVGAYALKGSHRNFVYVFDRLRELRSDGLPSYNYYARYNLGVVQPLVVFVPRVGLLAVSEDVQRIATSICNNPLGAALERTRAEESLEDLSSLQIYD
eukprot:TRINITY_DN18487_c0_g1_i4.p1 TRINITY_DN18487_c0_g1~~TRINITY_DN18487_c0_g1_i4.p1  ORF type:complete len:291 (-),score=46.39 TRINITY_DN18487_c0_g1_i4:12-884(-)